MFSTIALSVDSSPTNTESLELARILQDEGNSSLLVGLTIDGAKTSAERIGRLAESLQSACEVDEAAFRGEPADPAEIPTDFDTKTLHGRPHHALIEELSNASYDLVVLDAIRQGESTIGNVGSTCLRTVRKTTADMLIVKESATMSSDYILVAIDGSHESFAGLLSALELGKRFNKRVECVGVYDPYLHYTLFNGIVKVLSAEASKVFKFKDQEKLHEEIIDTGLAKIYQAHLEVSRAVAREHDSDVDITLLDGKAFQKILAHTRKRPPWLLVIGRTGVHSGSSGMDIGATAENLLRTVACNVLITSRTHVPKVDIQAHASVQWTPDAEAKMKRVPEFVRGVATTAIIRWSIERGHSVITPSVINSAMGELLPPGQAQAMGYVAEQVAIQADNLHEGITYVCPDCGYAAKDFRPTVCGVCGIDGTKFESIDRAKLESIGELERGDLEEEETFDGKKLKWSGGAKEVLRRVPSGYQRRRSKARIEKTARVRGLSVISQEFAVDVVEQDLAETSYLSKSGENLEVAISNDERPDDSIALPREESEFLWTAAAWKRMCRVPEGFMRDMTREEVEKVAKEKEVTEIDLELCEAGIAVGRQMMAEMVGRYQAEKKD